MGLPYEGHFGSIFKAASRRVPTSQAETSQPLNTTAHGIRDRASHFEKRLHVDRLQWEWPHDFSRGIKERRRNRGRCEGIRYLRTTAIATDFWPVEEHDFDLGNIRHLEDRVRPPVTGCDPAFVEHGFFKQRMGDTH